MKPAQALQQLKSEQQLSDVQVAAAIGVSESTINRLGAGLNNPRWDTMVKLAKAFPRFAELMGLVAA